MTSSDKFISERVILFNGDTFSIYATVNEPHKPQKANTSTRRFLQGKNRMAICDNTANCKNNILVIISWSSWLSINPYQNTMTSSDTTIYNLNSSSKIIYDLRLPIRPVMNLREYSILKESHNVDIFDREDPLFNDVCINYRDITQNYEDNTNDENHDSTNSSEHEKIDVSGNKDISLTKIRSKFDTSIICSSGCVYKGFVNEDFITCQCVVSDPVSNIKIYYEKLSAERSEISYTAYNGSKAFTCISAGFNSNTIFLNVGFLTFLIILTSSLVILFIYFKFPKYEVLNQLEELIHYEGYKTEASAQRLSVASNNQGMVRMQDIESKHTDYEQTGKPGDAGTNIEDNKVISATNRENEPKPEVDPSIESHNEENSMDYKIPDRQPKPSYDSNAEALQIKNNDTVSKDQSSRQGWNEKNSIDYSANKGGKKVKLMANHNAAKRSSTEYLNEVDNQFISLRTIKLLPINERLSIDDRSFCEFIYEELKLHHFFFSVFFRVSVIRPFPVRFLIFLMDISFMCIYCLLLISDNTIDGVNSNLIYLTIPLLSILLSFLSTNVITLLFLCSERAISEDLSYSLFLRDKKKVAIV